MLAQQDTQSYLCALHLTSALGIGIHHTPQSVPILIHSTLKPTVLWHTDYRFRSSYWRSAT